MVLLDLFWVPETWVGSLKDRITTVYRVCARRREKKAQFPLYARGIAAPHEVLSDPQKRHASQLINVMNPLGMDIDASPYTMAPHVKLLPRLLGILGEEKSVVPTANAMIHINKVIII